MVASAIPPSFHWCSTSLGSHSGSVPHSSSVPSDSHGQSLALSISTSEVSGPSRLSKEHKALLLDYLGIDRDLSSLEPSGLRTSYQKFTVIVNATPKVMSLGKDEEWKAQFDGAAVWVPNIVTFIDIFIAKSQFYQFWRPLFLQAQEYPDMRDWLNKDREAEVKKHDWKGKRKAPDSPKKKNHDRDQPVVQRKHKKAKQARDSEEEEEDSE